MSNLELLKQELKDTDYTGYCSVEDYYRYLGYMEHYNDDPLKAKAHAIAKLFTLHEKHIYDNDLVAGSIRGCYSNKYNEHELAYAKRVANSYGKNTFWTNVDHDAVDFEMALNLGVGGIINKINVSLRMHSDSKKLLFLSPR